MRGKHKSRSAVTRCSVKNETKKTVVVPGIESPYRKKRFEDRVMILKAPGAMLFSKDLQQKYGCAAVDFACQYVVHPGPVWLQPEFSVACSFSRPRFYLC